MIRPCTRCLVALCGFVSFCAYAGEVVWEIGNDAKFIAESQSRLANFKPSKDDELVELLYRARISHRADHVVERIQQIFYYGSDAAVSQHGTDSITWNSVEEDIRILEATVVKPDGSTVQFESSEAQIVDTDSYDVFTDQRKIIIHLPQLAKGVVSSISYERTKRGERPYFYSTYLQSQVKRAMFDVRLESADVLPNWYIDSDLVRCNATRTFLHCVARDLPPVKLDASVNYAQEVPILTISSSKSWDEVIDTLLPKIETSVANSKLLGKLADELQRGGDYESAALAFAAKKVRYVSMSQGENALFPHHVDETIGNLYGDCKDKSVLMLAMLRRAGIDSYPALVSTSRSDPEYLQLPGTGYFDHMVLCRRQNQGEICFDPTDPNTDSQTISSSIQGKVRLNLIPGSTPGRIPSAKYRWRMSTESEHAFLDDGGERETMRFKYFGEYASWIRSIVSGMTESERSEWMRDRYHELITESAETKFRVPQATTSTAEFRIEGTATIEPYLDIEKALNFSDAPYWLRSLVSSFKNDNEYYEYDFPGLQLRSEKKYLLKGRWQHLTSGPNLNYVSRFGTLSRNYRSAEDSVTVTTKIEMPAATISLEDKAQFNKFMNIVWSDSTIRFWGNKE